MALLLGRPGLAIARFTKSYLQKDTSAHTCAQQHPLPQPFQIGLSSSLIVFFDSEAFWRGTSPCQTRDMQTFNGLKSHRHKLFFRLQGRLAKKHTHAYLSFYYAANCEATFQSESRAAHDCTCGFKLGNTTVTGATSSEASRPIRVKTWEFQVV